MQSFIVKPFSCPFGNGSGGGGDATRQNFTRGGSAPRFRPTPFHITFLTEKVPHSYTSYTFYIPCLEIWVSFNCCKCTV